MRIGIVVALAAEARALPAGHGAFARHHRYQVMLAGPGPRRAEQAASALLGQGCDALLSFGLAGGLDPSLRAGALLNASAILTAEQASLPCSDALRTLLECELGDDVLHGAALYSAEQPVVSHAHKRALHERLAVLAVDMESAAIGRVARGRDVPFAALRCVVDPSDFSLPRAALVGMAEDGGNRPLASAAALLRRPWELPDLIRLALWYGGALRALRNAAARLCSQVR